MQQFHSYGHSIVLIGNFNPKIFHPAWFAAQNLIGEKDEEGAKVEIVHSDVAIFSLDWLKIEVLHDRFKALTLQQAYAEAVRDIVLGTFNILRHTPLAMMGINLDVHFRVNSEEVWHGAGHKLAPKEPWSGVLRAPGMLSLTMEDPRQDKYKGYTRVTVEPSRKVKPGLFFGVNDHYEVEDPSTISGSDEVIGMLNEAWFPSCKRAAEIVYTIFERITR